MSGAPAITGNKWIDLVKNAEGRYSVQAFSSRCWAGEFSATRIPWATWAGLMTLQRHGASHLLVARTPRVFIKEYNKKNYPPMFINLNCLNKLSILYSPIPTHAKKGLKYSILGPY